MMPEATAGIVLCGGLSRRMGRSKGELPFGDGTVLQRIVGTMLLATPELIVVGPPESARPVLPERVRYVRDEQSGQGPLAGLATGLRALPANCSSAYLTGCDTPLLTADFVRFVINQLSPGAAVAVPETDGIPQPLAAVYRRKLIELIEMMLADGERSLQALLRSVETVCISQEALIKIDPGLHSLNGMNTIAEYEELLQLFQSRKQNHSNSENFLSPNGSGNVFQGG